MAKRTKRKKIRFFYHDRQLHRMLSINRAADTCIAWNYPLEKTVGYVWSDLRRTYEKAFSLTDVTKMFGRARITIEMYILDGKINTPQKTYSLDGRKSPGKYLFSERDVLELHDYLLTVHVGRPRKDGRVNPGDLPSRAELRAMMRHDVQMYAKTEAGDFVPVWKEIDWS